MLVKDPWRMKMGYTRRDGVRLRKGATSVATAPATT